MQDTGTVAELSTAVSNAYSNQAAFLGHSELSKFGEKVIEQMYSKHKISEDPSQGLTLWEFNKYLDSVGSFTLYDMKEYKIIMNNLGILVDRDNFLRVEGLKAYYLKQGRLADDNLNIGIGSLNEELNGNVQLNVTYVPDAIASLFNLVGSNTLLPSKVIQYAAALISTKEVKMEGELKYLSEILDFLESLGFKLATYFKQRVLGSPGWLAEFVDGISQYFADGAVGVLPSLRSTVLKTFGKFDDFERIFTQDLNEKEFFSVDRDEELLNIQRNVDELLKPKATEDDEEEIEHEDKEKEKEEKAEKIRESKLSFRRRYGELIQKIVKEFLPKLSHTSRADLQKSLAQCKDDLIFLNEIHYDSSVHLTPEISQQIAERKEKLSKKILELETSMKENEDLLAAHCCAAYDAVRLLTLSTPSLGLGSADFCLRAVNSGIDWISLLPPGQGEYSPIRQHRFDKLERAKRRKSAALAALERERFFVFCKILKSLSLFFFGIRLRRNMTDEEKEKVRLEELRLQQEQWDLEEEELVGEVR